MQRKFNSIVDRLIPKQCRGVLLAVSGGVDSMTLATLFDSWRGCPLAIGHVNFHLRGDDSNSDEALVREWARSHSVPFYSFNADTVAYAREKHLSIEMAARDIRYEWFATMLDRLSFDFVALAHNANDQAETILLNFVRGTGLKGLCGMSEVSGSLLRPMLKFSRQEIVKWARKHSVEWHEDYTNNEDLYSRNKIRHNVLPVLVEINPSLLDTVRNNAEHLKLAWDVVQEQVTRLKESAVEYAPNPSLEGEVLSIDINKLYQSSLSQLFLHSLLSDYGFDGALCNSIMDSLAGDNTGKRFDSAYYTLWQDRGKLVLRSKLSAKQIEDKRLVREDFEKPDGFVVPKDGAVAYVDAERLVGDLEWRKWRSGDRFIPYGMRGWKKVSDFLTDRKVPLYKKEEVYVLTCGGEIVWVGGFRIDDRFKVTATTKKIARFSIE